jgi:hypothetical protein
MNSRRFNSTFLTLVVSLTTVISCAGQEPTQHSILEINGEKGPAAQSPQKSTPESIDASENINRIIRRLALEAIPHTYNNDKDWGGQEQRWDGLKFRRDEGGRLETKRKWKMVNHGTWKKYSATLINPEQNFQVEVKNFHQAANGNLAFDVHFGTRLRFDARQAKWTKGVQLYSISADGHGKIRLMVSCELDIDMDISKFPPDFIFTPTVTHADLIVDEFRIDRVSKLGGEFAQQVTRAARKILDDEVAEKESDLVQKINRKLSENQDDFRLSLADSIKQKWTPEVKELLPEPIRKALDSKDR